MFSIVTGESLNALVPWFFRNLKEIKFPQDVESSQYFPKLPLPTHIFPYIFMHKQTVFPY